MRLLVIDDDPDFRSLVAASAPAWLDVVTCSSSQEAMQKLAASPVTGLPFEIVLLDLCMPPLLQTIDEREGLALLRWMATTGGCPPAILVSAEERALETAIREGPPVVGRLRKPVDLWKFYRFLQSFQELFDRPGAASIG